MTRIPQREVNSICDMKVRTNAHERHTFYPIQSDSHENILMQITPRVIWHVSLILYYNIGDLLHMFDKPNSCQQPHELSLYTYCLRLILEQPFLDCTA